MRIQLYDSKIKQEPAKGVSSSKIDSTVIRIPYDILFDAAVESPEFKNAFTKFLKSLKKENWVKEKPEYYSKLSSYDAIKFLLNKIVSDLLYITLKKHIRDENKLSEMIENFSAFISQTTRETLSKIMVQNNK